MHSIFLLVAAGVFVAMISGAAILHLLPRLGESGRRASAWLCRAPGLDLVVTYFTAAPLFAGPIIGGWRGLAGAVVGQVAGVLVWMWSHELAHRRDVRGPRIVKVLNRIVGRWRNHAALWVMAPVTPGFWLLRMVELTVYPALCALVGLPRYREGDWVNVSRQKFAGLVGHDRIWCLYCDWMTGIWSLGSEMLRNIESFWCPIRFDSSKKCENCRIDFPDVLEHWVAADGNMGEVAQTLEMMYSNGDRSWFGRRVQLSVGGKKLVSK